MYVSVNESDSTVRTTKIGLPAGVCNFSFTSSTTNKLNFIHFADDMTIDMRGRDLNTLCENVCEEFNKVEEWSKAN